MKRWLLSGPLGLAMLCGGCAGVHMGLYVRTPPPPLRVEVYGAPPAAGYMWLPGYWGYSGGAYVWMPGRWARPPRGRMRWEEGRWEHRGDRYFWHDGRWR